MSLSMNGEFEDPSALPYDPLTIRFHWATAGLVALLWIMGRTTGWMPRGPLRVDIWSVHVLLGLCLAGVIVSRIAWRLGRGRILPPAERGLMGVAATIVHGALYALLLAIVALGMANVLVRGFPMFNLWTLPQLGDEAAARMINEWHGLVANAIVTMAGLHAAAALFHHYARRDGVLARMVPKLRSRRR
jgi:cytochrome b561